MIISKINVQFKSFSLFLCFIIILIKRQSMELKLRSCVQHSPLKCNRKDKQLLQLTFMEQTKKKVKRNTSKDRKVTLNPYEEIPFIPQIQLTKQDMQGDPIPILLKLQQKYKNYGAVKIKSCSSWKPPFCFKYTDNGITTRVQKIHKLKKGKAFEQIQDAYNVRSFEQFASKFQNQYKFKFQKQGSTTQSQIQNQYWNLVKGIPQNCSNPSKFKVTVQYAADLPVTKHGSGFPIFQTKASKDENFNYKQNYFNLNNLYKTPTSILRIADQKRQFISGITTPWVYMGMLFSSFCWHVEDLWLNSVNYNHKGGIKTWYVVPAADKQKFDDFVSNKTGRPQVLDRITYMLDPLQIKKAGIRIFKTYQRPGDYICTFVKAYHSGFSQGFNVGQAVNFICPQSLKTIKQAQECYQKNAQRKPSVISLQWLVHQNFRTEKVPLIKKQFQEILQSQLNYLKGVIKRIKIKQVVQLDELFKYDKNSCSACRKYLYLSSLKCLNCEKKYCQKHLHQCCGKGFALVIRKPFGKRKKNIQTIQNLL